MMTDTLSWIAVYPEIILLVMACAITLIDLGVRSRLRSVTHVTTLAALAVVAMLQYLYADSGSTFYSLHNMVVSDPMGN